MKRLAPLILAVPLLLVGCSSPSETETEAAPETTTQTEWASGDEKLRVFMEHVCLRDGIQSTIEPYTQASAAAIHVLAEPTSSQEDERIALDITTRPADAYEQDVAWAEAGGGEVSEHSVPRTLTPENPATCEGWVWEKHLDKVYESEYSDFTYAEAREVGAV